MRVTLGVPMVFEEAKLPRGVYVELCRIGASQPKTWCTWLSAEERDRLKGYTRLKRRREFVAGRAAARLLLGRLLECHPSDVPLAVEPDGSVTVGVEPWHLSIAHSGEYAVAASAEGPVGVDLEGVTRPKPGIYRFLVHPEERDFWPEDPAPELFTMWWVAKEAVLKARRSGFRLMASKLRTVEPPTKGKGLIYGPDGSRWNIWAGRDKDYCWAVARPAGADTSAERTC